MWPSSSEAGAPGPQPPRRPWSENGLAGTTPTPTARLPVPSGATAHTPDGRMAAMSPPSPCHTPESFHTPVTSPSHTSGATSPLSCHSHSSFHSMASGTSYQSAASAASAASSLSYHSAHTRGGSSSSIGGGGGGGTQGLQEREDVPLMQAPALQQQDQRQQQQQQMLESILHQKLHQKVQQQQQQQQKAASRQSNDEHSAVHPQPPPTTSSSHQPTQPAPPQQQLQLQLQRSSSLHHPTQQSAQPQHQELHTAGAASSQRPAQQPQQQHQQQPPQLREQQQQQLEQLPPLFQREDPQQDTHVTHGGQMSQARRLSGGGSGASTSSSAAGFKNRYHPLSTSSASLPTSHSTTLLMPESEPSRPLGPDARPADSKHAPPRHLRRDSSGVEPLVAGGMSSNEFVGSGGGGDRGPKMGVADSDPGHMRRVILSSIIGNTLEWYDFLVFSTFGDVISRLFFPPTNVYSRLLAFYGIFAAGFLTRPLGALVFGYIGDRYGRKSALVLSIYVMSIPTMLVGCLPTYRMAGMAAPLLLVLIRVAQGFAVGGEFTATMVFLVEHAPPEHRGLHGSWAFASVMTGVITGSLVATAFNVALTEEQLLSWGWRVALPHLHLRGWRGRVHPPAPAGAHVQKMPALEPELDESNDHAPPPGGLLRNERARLLAAIGTVFVLDLMNAIGFYLTVIFLPTYFQDFVGLSRGPALIINTSNMLVYMVQIPVGGWLSDKYGRRNMILGPALLMAVAAYPLWTLFRSGSAAGAWFVQICLVLIMATYTGGLPATFSSLFASGSRCTGLSLGHNLSMTVFGGTAPLLATGLLKGTGDLASPAALLIIAASLTCVGALLLRKFGIS
ncbi:MAG: hypothetical protein WDW36_006304 [Sanguina aurantia]